MDGAGSNVSLEAGIFASFNSLSKFLCKDKVLVSIDSSSRFHVDAMISSPGMLPLRFTSFYRNP